MKRISHRTTQEQLDYHLKRNDTPNFSLGQPGRVELARFLIDKILRKDLIRRPLKIVELGCGSGDISGPYSVPNLIITYDLDGIEQKFHGDPTEVDGTISDGHSSDAEVGLIDVIGVDVVPQAAISCGQRWPNMTTLISPVEELEPFESDILVMTEFLEHLVDPVKVAQEWMALAKWVVIGHPLNEPDPPFEPGHAWSYTIGDFYAWFERADFHCWERFLFPMGHWDNMVMGHGSRRDSPPYRG